MPDAGDLRVVELHGVPGVLLGMDDLRRPHMLLSLGPAEAPKFGLGRGDVGRGCAEPLCWQDTRNAFLMLRACSSPLQMSSSISSRLWPTALR